MLKNETNSRKNTIRIKQNANKQKQTKQKQTKQKMSFIIMTNVCLRCQRNNNVSC